MCDAQFTPRVLLVNVALLALQLTDNWAFGSALCHVIPTAFAVVVFSSSFNLMMIAVDRYILIVRPLDRRMSPPAALAGVVVVALLATGAALPIDARGPRRRGRRGAAGHRRRPADRRTRRRGGGRRRAAPAAPRLLHRALFRS